MAYIYVAGKFENKMEVRRAQRLLRESGHDITHDWTEEDESKAPLGGLGAYLRDQGRKDLDGAISADVLLMLFDPTSRGAFVELGAALTSGASIYVVFPPGQGTNSCIFFHLDGVQAFSSLEAAVEAINSDWAGERYVMGVCPKCGLLLARGSVGGPSTWVPYHECW